MREKPSGCDLLEIARDTLRSDIIPALPESKRYQARMIANAMAIVMRQIGTSVVDDRQAAMTRDLAARVRRGEAGGREVWQALYDVALIRVADSNPKFK